MHVFGMHHVYKRKNAQKRQRNSIKFKCLDASVYFAAILNPLMTIPQVYIIYAHKEAVGVSTISWGAYVVTSFIWFIYGLAHREKPIIFANLASGILSFLIALGTVIYK